MGSATQQRIRVWVTGAAAVSLASTAAVLYRDRDPASVRMDWPVPLELAYRRVFVLRTAAQLSWRLLRFRRVEADLDEPRVAQWHAETAAHCARACSRLGGLYVKLAQAISSMPGSLRGEYMDALLPLTDSAACSSWQHAKMAIERELQRPLGELFSRVDTTPLACASIAQTHRAVLRSDEGHQDTESVGATDAADVVVKVQHFRIKEQMVSDLRMLHAVLWCAGFWRDVDRKVLRFLIKTLDGLERDLLTELDFVAERSNADAVRPFFEKYAANQVTVPRMYPAYSTDRVLTMERIPGRRIDDAVADMSPEERRQVSDALAECLSVMLFRAGLFHADLHAANVFAVQDSAHEREAPTSDAAGAPKARHFRIALLDHAQYCRIDRDARLRMCEMIASTSYSFNDHLLALVQDNDAASNGSPAESKQARQPGFDELVLGMMLRPEFLLRAVQLSAEERRAVREHLQGSFAVFLDGDPSDVALRSSRARRNGGAADDEEDVLQGADTDQQHRALVLIRSVALGHELHKRVVGDRKQARFQRSLIYVWDALDEYHAGYTFPLDAIVHPVVFNLLYIFHWSSLQLLGLSLDRMTRAAPATPSGSS
ncbi:putative aarF domain-containing protein kinase 1 [Porphyridium purpureum]|uniref:Putative aarF domain-containing protein kinase 1 n=1 Tax=Porphyridium purpureum TaxID=35688 RepID=A0A5J4Z2F0_PORPP|nr:putative aarF domain-containing protein kinase 1 [Porphyridium purpureum]|eukprot:POR4882..scf208_2